MLDTNKIRKRVRDKLDYLVDHSYADGTVLFNLEKLSEVSPSKLDNNAILDKIAEAITKTVHETSVEV